MTKTLYRRREFLEPIGTSQTAYVYAYLEDHYKSMRKGKPQKRGRYDVFTEFGFHDGNETLHLHFEFDRHGKALRRDVQKLRKLADVANGLADKLEKL